MDFTSIGEPAVFWTFIGIACAWSAICCCFGFKKFVWFLSVGYGAAVFGLGLFYAITGIAIGHWDIILLVQCLLLMAYGFRLAGFLLIRELKSASYQKVLKNDIKTNEKPIPFFVKFFVWIIVAILYVMQTSPILARISKGDLGWPSEGGASAYVLPCIGIAISVIGLILETIGDKQKSAQKKENPNMVATKGLYKMVRCPNYFGEILFWTGVFVGGIASYGADPWKWVFAALGYVCIVYIMFNGAERLDRRQEQHYGENSEYRAYADHTPIIIPLIPLHHLGDYKGLKPKKNRKEKK